MRLGNLAIETLDNNVYIDMPQELADQFRNAWNKYQPDIVVGFIGVAPGGCESIVFHPDGTTTPPAPICK